MARKLYQVGEVVERVGICRTTLYKWEEQGKITTPRRNVSGYRVYSESEVRQIEKFKNTLYVPVDKAKAASAGKR